MSARAGGPGRLQGLGQDEAILAPVLRRRRGPQGNAPEGNQKNRRKFRRLQPEWAAGLVCPKCWECPHGARAGCPMPWERLRASAARQKRGTEVKAVKGITIGGRQWERQRGNKFRAHQLPKLFGVSYTDISPR